MPPVWFAAHIFMDVPHLQQLLEQVRTGETSVDDAMKNLRQLPFEDLGFAKVDHHRAIRHGMPEVIFGKGKTPEQVQKIAGALLAKSKNLLLTRATPEMAAAIQTMAAEA